MGGSEWLKRWQMQIEIAHEKRIVLDLQTIIKRPDPYSEAWRSTSQRIYSLCHLCILLWCTSLCTIDQLPEPWKWKWETTVIHCHALQIYLTNGELLEQSLQIEKNKEMEAAKMQHRKAMRAAVYQKRETENKTRWATRWKCSMCSCKPTSAQVQRAARNRNGNEIAVSTDYSKDDPKRLFTDTSSASLRNKVAQLAKMIVFLMWIQLSEHTRRCPIRQHSCIKMSRKTGKKTR